MSENIQENPGQEDPLPEEIEEGTEKSKPETEMEVHHHPRLDHSPKPWKEYLLEGLMIFVAVMMGFIAENIRERITNHEHVRELTSQFVRDLKTDIIQLNGIYLAENKIQSANDSLIRLLGRPHTDLPREELQRLIIGSHNLWPYYPSTGAMAAIKNELHLRAFSSSKIIGLISGYEKHIELLHTIQEITLQYQRNYIDPFLIKHISANDLQNAFNKQDSSKTEFRNLTDEDLSQLGSQMVLIGINTGELITNNRKILADATNLFEYLEVQFHPED